jgi:hypothetical protein
MIVNDASMPLPSHSWVLPLRAARVAERLLDGEIVLYDPLHQRVHVLNATAATLWRLFDGRHAVPDIVDALAESYPESRQAIEADVVEIVEHCRAQERFEP